ncbi:MAG: ATP-grasp domain-containing protein [Saprospirales bacterium]|nr:ATP-grasp domain-containing protein [Saprospirales bacterium]MBK8489418.1 ATP-grasp domain-containing protein [Saprospirales bacterium]
MKTGNGRRKLTIAVTGLNNIDSPGPGIPVIRGLKEAASFDVRIVGLAYENLEPGIYMHDMVDKAYQIPYPTVGHDTLLARIEYIHAQEKLDVIIPNFDAELYSFIKIQPRLEQLGIHMLLPTLEQFDARLKGKLFEFGEKYDIEVPKSSEVFSVDELAEKLKKYEYPVAIKGKFYEAGIAYSYEQAKSYFHKIGAKWGTPIIIQEFIKGQELNVTALGDGKGRTIGAVPMRKTYITDSGKGWAGISLGDPSLVKMAEKLISKTKWAGGLELELIKEEKTGKIYLIEINPRFPAWVYLAVGCGQNHPEALVRMALGEKIAPFKKFDVGKMFIRYSYDMICDMADFKKMAIDGER